MTYTKQMSYGTRVSRVQLVDEQNTYL